jgi:hypothetical protein
MCPREFGLGLCKNYLGTLSGFLQRNFRYNFSGSQPFAFEVRKFVAFGKTTLAQEFPTRVADYIGLPEVVCHFFLDYNVLIAFGVFFGLDDGEITL